MNDIRWQMFKPEALPDVLFGNAPTEKIGNQYIHRVALDENLIAVGFSVNDEKPSYNPPILIVISEKFIPEALSWLKVYAPQTSPLSQLARVISIGDWDTFQDAGLRKISSQHRTDSWSSIVLGEVLSQGEADVELSATPLSRSYACFSTAVARASIIHGNSDATSSCIERLKKLASDNRFVRRPVSVDDLLPIWKIMFARVESNSLDVLSEAILETAKKFTLNLSINSGAAPTLSQYPLLQSNSIEERTITYKKLASEVMLNFADSPYSIYSSALLAVAAFMVGRSTSHAFLLRPLSKRLPTVFAWFGLIAALAGPKSWDTDWSRAAKGIERLLRTKFDWSDPPLSDLCWEEYLWLSHTFEGSGVFNTLPKMLPKVLSVEIIPGALCQLRLTSGNENNRNDIEIRKNLELEQRDAALQSTLLQLANITQKTLNLLNVTNIPLQQTLGLDNSEQPSTKGNRAKRSKRNEN